MKFLFFNDTGRTVRIHPATYIHCCQAERTPIEPLEERLFVLPQGTFPVVKLWDHGQDIGLKLLVSPMFE